MSIGVITEETIQERVIKDLHYINNDIITQIKSGKDEYCKFSKPLKAICVLSFTKSSYIKYWTQTYAKYPKEKRQIIEACENLFKYKLTPKDKMIELIENGKDNTSDKMEILCILKGLPLPKKLSASEQKRQDQLRNFISQWN